jgi:GT2 family glycosyltransferase
VTDDGALVFVASDHPAVSIVVLATRDGARFRRCLAALAAADDPAVPTELLVVLNAATPDVRSVAPEVAGARLVTSAVDLGTAASWNRAVERARAPLVAIVHEDARVAPGWIGRLVGAFAADPLVAVAGAELRDPDGRPQSRGWVMWRDGGAWSFVQLWPAERTWGPDPFAVDSVSSATVVLDRALWRAMGGFDERFFPAVGVDHDLGLAAWARGRRVVHVPGAVVHHDTGAMVHREGGAAASRALRDFLKEHNHARIGAKWVAELADHAAPPDGPDLAVVEGELARVARRSAILGARTRVDVGLGERGTSHPPVSERPITGGLVDDDDAAPAEAEARAAARRAAVVGDLTPWAVDRYDALRRATAHVERSARDLAIEAMSLQARVVEVERERDAAEDARARSLAELAAMRATRTWRTRERLLDHPWVGTVLRGLARRTARRRGAVR